MKKIFIFLISVITMGSACNNNSTSQEANNIATSKELPAFEHIILIPRLAEITIDGKDSDWPDDAYQANLWCNLYGETVSQKDLSANIKLGWNNKGLLLVMNVSDDSIYEVNTRYPFWRGDAISVYFSPEKGNYEFVQYSFSPGLSENYTQPRVKATHIKNAKPVNNPVAKPDIATKRISGGYCFETLIPFSALHMPAHHGTEAGLQLILSDSDKARDNEHFSMHWFYTTGLYLNPYALYRIKLVEKCPPAKPITVRAFVQDIDTAHFVFCGDSSLAGSEITIKDHEKIIFSGALNNQSDTCLLHVKLPAPGLDSAYVPTCIYLNDTLIETIDFSMAQLKYAYTQPYPFEKEIRFLEMQDRISFPDSACTLFVGSSSIREWKTLRDDLSELNAVNKGFGGSRIDHVLHYFDRLVLPYQPSKIFIYEGDNDMAHGRISPQQFVDSCKVLVKQIRQKKPDVEIYFISIKPSPRRKRVWYKMKQANRLLKEFAQTTPNVGFIDVAGAMLNKSGNIRNDIWLDDRLHMNEKGYEIWTETIRTALKKQ